MNICPLTVLCIDAANAPFYVRFMSILEILTIPDKRLRAVCEPVAVVDDAIRAFAADMIETMHDAQGVGLAAIQVGVAKRIIVVDMAEGNDDPSKPTVLINPEIVWASDEQRCYNEGCLSVPDYYEDVDRPDRVRVRFLDLDGKTQELELAGRPSTCVQHEIDHLNGMLFIDHLSRLKRALVVKKFEKRARLASRQ